MRVLDAAGLPIETTDLPEITTTAPRGFVNEVRPAGSVPGTFHASLRVGRADANGLNVFTVKAGGATRDIIFIIY